MLNRRLGRYLGPSFDVGEAMSAKILTDKGHTVHRTSVFPITEEEQRSKTFTAKTARYEESLAAHVGARQANSPDGFGLVRKTILRTPPGFSPMRRVCLRLMAWTIMPLINISLNRSCCLQMTR